MPRLEQKLFPDAAGDIKRLEAIIAQRLLNKVSGDEWREIICEGESDFTYTSLSLSHEPGAEPMVRIEVGVQSEEARRAEGVFTSGWSRDGQKIEALDIILIDGKPGDVPSFLSRFESYLALPVTVFEVIERD